MSGQRVAVAATGEQALAAGLGVAVDGGNAVDAAMAAAFVALSTEPGMVSFGGGAFVSVWPADGDPVVVDGNVEMPGRGAPDAAFGAGVREVVHRRTAAGSSCTPAPGRSRRRGSCRRSPSPTSATHGCRGPDCWRRPTRAAREGYPMSPAASRYLGFTADSPLRRGRGGPRPGDRGTAASCCAAATRRATRLLADVIDELAVEGPSLFTTGRVGRALVESMATGGLVTPADLAAYTPVVRAAHPFAVGDWTVATNPPPAVGGPVLAVMLGELARRGVWTWSDAIEVQRAVLGYRLDVHDLSADLDADGLALLAAVGERGLSAPCAVALDRAHLRRRRRRQRVRDHDEQRVRRRASASPARASSSTTASARSSSTAAACTPCRRAPAWPPTWPRRRRAPRTVAPWRSAHRARTGSPAR